jgi:hypothetical protein
MTAMLFVRDKKEMLSRGELADGEDWRPMHFSGHREVVVGAFFSGDGKNVSNL